MKEIKRCSISGVGFTFENEAYSCLAGYFASLRESYRSNADCEEILADIEARVAELILSAQDSQSVVTLPVVENIILQLGSPEAISGEDGGEKRRRESSRIERRLYRDLEGAKLGGVCSGLAKYFGVEAVWLRLALFAPLILLFFGAIPQLFWLPTLGGNLFGIVLLVYLILWFAIPAAKTARQRLEMEGEPVSAQNIANHQGATQEERAKSSVASVVTTFSRVAVVVMKILLGLLLFPATAFAFALLLMMIALFADLALFDSFTLGSLGSFADVAVGFGIPFVLFVLLLLFIPTIYICYLIVALLVNGKPRLWVLLVAILLWLLTIVAVAVTGVGFAKETTEDIFSSDDRVELMECERRSLERQIMEHLDSAPDAEQRAEIEQLINDSTAPSIDR